MLEEEEPSVKICILGENTGMNQEIGRMISDEVFETDYISVQGVDICSKKVILDNKEIIVILAIIMEDERSKNFRSSFYHGAKGFVVFFDKGDSKSFEAVPHWIRDFQENVKINAPGFIIGIDTKFEEISIEQGKRLAKQLFCTYAESTPTDKDRITEILSSLVRQIIVI